MLLSVVSGTYNRKPHLQRMMDSVRSQMPRHIPYEFVIVDGGSNDGTLEWLDKQLNVRMIRHGQLLGAINAFTDGARAAQGEYVILANDDIVFHPYSILRALAHLEDHPTCGAVAFADNRAAQMSQGIKDHQVLGMPATSVEGEQTMVHYAQVGMFRRWLGEMAGWWGAEDQIMSKARTYGGDNYLSSRIWELGYAIDAVKGCAVDDLIVRDEMRTINSNVHYSDSAVYYQRYPRGARLQPAPTILNRQPERMRIIVMPIYESSFPAEKNLEYGLSEALAAAGLTWEIDYVSKPFDLPKAVWAWQPHLLLTQMHGGSNITAQVLRRARELKPDMVVVNWNGDAHEGGLLSDEIMEKLQFVDLQTVVNAKVLPEYEKRGIPAEYWQIGFKDPATPLPPVTAHDVVFLGNCYNDDRYVLVEALRGTGRDVGIYGVCPGSVGNTHYSFAASRALYEQCQIAVSDTYPNATAFVSNRLFQALSGGAFVLQQHSPQLDQYNGLIPGGHYVEWQTPDELPGLIDEWMGREEERAVIAAAGRDYVREHFNYDAQIAKLWGLLP